MKHLFLVLIFCCLGCSSNPTENYDLIISNVNLIDGTGNSLQESVNIYVKDSRIVKISQNVISSKSDIIDGTGKYLIPGLIDCHTHPSPYIENFPRFIHYGVTSILVTGCSLCTNDHYSKLRDAEVMDSISAPRVFHTSQHFTMEGRHPVKTYASSNWREGETVFFLRDTSQIAELVNQVTKYPILGIKLTIEDGPFPPLVERMPQRFVNKVVKEATKNGIEVFAHASDNEELFMAQRAGVKNYLHYVMIDLDWERDSTVIQGLAQNHTSIVTTLMLKKSWLYPLNPDWIDRLKQVNIYDEDELKYLSDPARKGKSFGILKGRKFMRGDTIPTVQQMVANQIEDLKLLSSLGVNITLGTDTGNEFILPGISLHEEMEIMEMGGFTPLEIIKMTTYNAATMLKKQDSIGSIQVGKLADMILLNKNPLESINNTEEINLVFKNGEIQKRLTNTTTNKR